jgi:hypothetical protein
MDTITINCDWLWLFVDDFEAERSHVLAVQR